ncbi:MAG: RagB/SusD family nutrient uptake outer membrane protein [Bacteroides sp.]|nr:RagB/SusD family nutrient uptake outer membrane protein [Bacteroides sp.]MCM1378490.1 RagB/SusD family nutrient uptake outer membrane protein [Bacteroides sp.]MCM1444791.1 RagB/SusD family nutrient uptake outer membrane protein [Prevotella sp.]
MKTNKKIYAFAAAAALTLSSCSGFLDTPTDTRVDLVNTEQVRMLMNGAYPMMSYAWPCEIMSDNMEDNNSPVNEDGTGIHYNLSSYDRGDEEMFRWESCVSNNDTDSPSGIWEGFYNSIAVCNAVMEKLDQWREENGGLDETQSAVYAEAQILRAFDHFILAQVFCQPYRGSLSENYLGIPYITKPETTVKPHYERGTLAETYKKIQEDLEAALPNIQNTLYGVPKYHFNTTAANAFAARFYLFTRQYKKALECANAVFGGAENDPTPYLSDVWAKSEQFYYIRDIGLYQNGVDKQSNFLLYPTHSVLLRRLGSGCRYGVIRDALNSTIHGLTPAWDSPAFQYALKSDKTNTYFSMQPCYAMVCINNGQSEYGSGMCANVSEQFEYTDKIAGIGYAHLTVREFYGEETLLTRAEAKLFLGDSQGAVDDLSAWEKIRRNCPFAVGNENDFKDYTIDNLTTFYSGEKGKRFGAAKPINIDRVCPENDGTVTAEAIMPLLQAVQHIRRIETIHTGMRWFDIKRFGIEIDRKIGNKEAPLYHTKDRLTLEDPRRAVQIPSEVVTSGMQPNPRGTVETLVPSSEYVSVK